MRYRAVNVLSVALLCSSLSSVMLIPQAQAIENSTVSLSGAFKVSQQGAATYSLPIDVPNARGLKPN